MAELLRREIALRCSPAHAFRVFTEKVDLWWPRGHRKTPAGTLAFDRERLVEHSADGGEWTMARVVAWEPPQRLALDWYPGSPAAPTSVEVSFSAAGGGTSVTIVHQPLTPAAAEIWPQRAALFTRGWEAVLPALRDFAEQET